MTAPLLIEIGCEEIPARMIRSAAADLGARIRAVLERAGVPHGDLRAWGGCRRLMVRVDAVEDSQPTREERILGPPVDAAFDAEGRPTAAALGFARKQGTDPSALEVFDTSRGRYVGVQRTSAGLTLEKIIADALPTAVQGMVFPKTMRWGEGKFRWVRPVHWLLALHGSAIQKVTLFDARSGGETMGHRFLAPGSVTVGHADDYEDTLRRAFVLADPAKRRASLTRALHEAASAVDAVLVEDAELLAEVADLVEWPGVVTGSFDESFLSLPREILVTALRHHQKCFSVEADGALRPVFLAVANTDGDAAGHIRRGNEWVVTGRLEDARFFWEEDLRTPLSARVAQLDGVVFHAKCGTYGHKARRMEELSAALAAAVGFPEDETRSTARAALLAKADLLTSLVGEFPELQGLAGGLILRQQGESPTICDAVYGHYRPTGPVDSLPATDAGCLLSMVDKLDTLAELIKAGERPTGSRDPLGIRRAANGLFRIATERTWPVSLRGLSDLTGGDDAVLGYLRERLVGFLRDAGYSRNEILAVIRPRIDEHHVCEWHIHDIVARVEAIKGVRGRDDFRHLVKLTERVDNILARNDALVRELAGRSQSTPAYVETQDAAIDLQSLLDRLAPEVDDRSRHRSYAEIIDMLSQLIEPVDRFFDDVLVIDREQPHATSHRFGVLLSLRDLLTKYFDVRELAGQAERRP